MIDRENRILFVCSRLDTMVNKRLPLINRLLKDGWEVGVLSMERHKDTEALMGELGIAFKCIDLSRNSLSVIPDLAYSIKARKFIKEFNPSVVMSYTIKPNVYCGFILLSLNKKIRFIPVVTGLGFAFHGASLSRKITRYIAVALHKISFLKASKVVFQNDDNKSFFSSVGIAQEGSCLVIPGDGVDIPDNWELSSEAYRNKVFLCISRVLGEKGLRELREAANTVKKQYPEFSISLYGPLESSPDAIDEEELGVWQQEQSIIWRGYATDVPSLLQQAYCFVMPSHHEGMCTAVAEAIAYGVPVVGTDIAGIREMVEKNGKLVPVRCATELAKALAEMLQIDEKQWMEMSKISRQRAEELVDRDMLMGKLFRVINNDA